MPRPGRSDAPPCRTRSRRSRPSACRITLGALAAFELRAPRTWSASSAPSSRTWPSMVTCDAPKISAVESGMMNSFAGSARGRAAGRAGPRRRTAARRVLLRAALPRRRRRQREREEHEHRELHWENRVSLFRTPSQFRTRVCLELSRSSYRICPRKTRICRKRPATGRGRLRRPPRLALRAAEAGRRGGGGARLWAEWHSASFARKACMLVCKVLGAGARGGSMGAHAARVRERAAVRGRRGVRGRRAGAEARAYVCAMREVPRMPRLICTVT